MALIKTSRRQDAVVQLKARMREPIRAQLEGSAKRRGVSLNTELVDRLEQSFAREDAFGGPEIANMARLMAAAFLRGGQGGAHARGRPKSKASQWIYDPFCYAAATAAVVDALNAMQPVQSNQPKQPDRHGRLIIRYHDNDGFEKELVVDGEKERVFAHERQTEPSK
jgi:hypothetical protein